MSVQIQPLSKDETFDLLRGIPLDTGALAYFQRCVNCATTVHACRIDGKLVCLWGLVPPSLISDDVYLWLHVTGDIRGNEFLFVRHSQLVLQEILEKYPTVVGHTLARNKQVIKWLTWLGAEFVPAQDGILRFTIRREDHGA